MKLQQLRLHPLEDKMAMKAVSGKIEAWAPGKT